MTSTPQQRAPAEKRPFYELSKRLFDLSVCVLALPLLALPLIFIAAAIRLVSPGPVLYRGVRTGQFGVPFRIFKFRTMVTGAELLGAGTTSRDDPRVFPLGRFLRRYKLDELPQVFNVLIGHMSLVGPRPELPKYTRQYTGEQLCILSVKPGITDLSSIEFRNLDQIVGATDAERVFEEKILQRKNDLRIDYVKRRTFFLDLRLVVLTVICVIRKAN